MPWSTFARIVARYDGDARVRTLRCAEQYRAMAFAQLTYRESLRDIEVCLSAQASKLYRMGFREPVRRSTPADAALFQEEIGNPIGHVDIPEAQNTRAEYSATMVKDAPHPEAARVWLDFIAGETALRRPSRATASAAMGRVRSDA
jgi:hypothetical protein